MVLNAAGSKLLRADTETPLSARSGDLLFAGDGLKTETGAASFLFCPAKAIDTLSASGEVRFEAKQPKVTVGQDLRAAGARLHAAADLARGRREPAALWREHDARHQQAGGAADAAR